MSGIDILQITVSVLNVIVFGSAIPFAFRVVRELATITATLKGMGWQEDSINKLQDEVQGIKLDMARGGE